MTYKIISTDKDFENLSAKIYNKPQNSVAISLSNFRKKIILLNYEKQ